MANTYDNLMKFPDFGNSDNNNEQVTDIQENNVGENQRKASENKNKLDFEKLAKKFKKLKKKVKKTKKAKKAAKRAAEEAAKMAAEEAARKKAEEAAKKSSSFTDFWKNVGQAIKKAIVPCIIYGVKKCIDFLVSGFSRKGRRSAI